MKAFFAAAAFILVAASAAVAAENTLVADSMTYDPNAGVITAAGNIHATNPDGEVFGDFGIGTLDGNTIEMTGSVRGHYRDAEGSVINFSCDSALIVGRDSAERVITGSGNVELSRGGDRLSADHVVWHTGAPVYSASGGVRGEFDTYSIDADEVSRNHEDFSAQNVRRFYERMRNITMSASEADGIIRDDGVAEMTARGNVVITMPDSEGVMTRATGNTGVFSETRGTVVLSGGAAINQTGRVLNSENIVYFLDTGLMDAHGNPSIVFEMDR